MKVYSQLEKAQLENVTTSPGSDPEGMVSYRTDTDVLQVSNGTTYDDLAYADKIQQLTNKDIDGGTAADTSRITFPKATKAVLDGLTRKEGTVVYATDRAQLFYDNGSTLLEIGSGSGSGGINYVTNPNAENDASDWNLYNDGSVDTPVDGTGGSAAGVTFVRSTGGTPLRGVASFLLSKDNFDRQGQGASTDLTIDSADRYFSLAVTFDYEIDAGTYADDDVGVYLIETSGPTVKKVGDLKNVTEAGKFRGTVTVDGNSTWRLAFHTQSSSALSWAIRLDNVKVTPDNLTVVTNNDDWKSFTPTGSWSTNTTYAGRWRRVGDTAEFEVNVSLSGVPDTASLTIDLPFGWTIDTAKLTSSTQFVSRLGSVRYGHNGFGRMEGQVLYDTTTSVALFSVNDDAASTHVSAAVSESFPRTAGSGDEHVARFSVPISGWSTNFAFSEDSPNVVAVYETDAAQTVADTNTDIIDFEYLVIDTHNAVTTGGSWAFTAPVGGKYVCAATLRINDLTASAVNDNLIWEVYKNGSLERRIDFQAAKTTSSVGHGLSGDCVVDLAAGDTIDFRLTNNLGSTVTLQNNGAVCFCSIQKLGTEINIGTQTKVVAAYEVSASTANASFANAATEIVDFDTALKDSHGIVTVGASWSASIPKDGDYMVTVALVFSSVTPVTLNDRIRLLIHKNGTFETVIDILRAQQTSGSLGPSVNGAALITGLSVGDTIDIRVDNTLPTMNIGTSAGNCRVSISSV